MALEITNRLPVQSLGQATPPREAVPSTPADTVQLRAELDSTRQQISALRSQAPAGIIQMDPATGVISAQSLKLQDFTVDNLKVTIPKMPSTISNTLGVDRMIGGMRDGANPLSDFGNLADSAMVINDLQLRVPSKTVSRAIGTMEADALRSNGIKRLDVDFAPGGRMNVDGVAHFVVDVPFKVGATMQSQGDRTLAVRLKSLATSLLPIFGPIFPVLGPLKSILFGIATSSTSSNAIQAQGLDGLNIDIGKMMSDSLQMDKVQVTTGHHEVIVHGQSGTAAAAPDTDVQQELNAAKATLAALQANPQQADDGVIRLDPTTGTLTARNIKTADYTVEELKVRIPAFPSVLQRTMGIETLAGSLRDAKNPVQAFEELTSGRMIVEKLTVTMPSATVAKALDALEGDTLAQQGVRNVAIDLKPGGQMTVTGRAKRGLEVGFKMAGQLSSSDGKIGVDMTGLKAGLLPLPHALLGAVMRVAMSAVTSGSIQARGDRGMAIDPSQLLPSNMEMKIQGIETGDGQLTLHAGL